MSHTLKTSFTHRQTGIFLTFFRFLTFHRFCQSGHVPPTTPFKKRHKALSQ